MNFYGLNSTLILPFRSRLPACQASGQFLSDEWDSNLALRHEPFVHVPTGKIDTSLFTIADVSTSLKFAGEKESARTWAKNNAGAIVADTILPRLNYLFLLLKRSYPQLALTGCLRSVGDIDLIFSTLFFERECIQVRGSSSLTAGLASTPSFLLEGRRRLGGPIVADPSSPGPMSKEWIAITRAVDLVNHGYFAEAVLVGFAQLDAVVQDFVTDRMPNLEQKVRRLGGHRLETMLGPFLRICLAASPLDDEQVKKGIKWLNKKRNGIMHGGDECHREESQRALRIVWGVLVYLNAKGASYSLPDELEFYTPAASEP